ncbi:MAG: AMP-binding protein [Siphonobacter aquaeclarae]|nr:AMP-binding protein [Siphonobacter aquaeclarae]
MILQKILHTAGKYPEKEAVVYGDSRLTYGALVEEVRRRAAAVSAGIRETNVLLIRKDPQEALLDLLALMAAGKATLFGSRQLSATDCSALTDRFSAFSLTDETVLQPSDTEPEWKTGLLSDRFLGVLSSGTEGTPKVIWKDYQSWVSAFPHQSDIFGLDTDDRLFILDALSYSANLNAALHMLWLGGTVVMASLKSAAGWTLRMREERITSVFMVPSHYRLWSGKAGTLEQMRSLVSAGEKLDIVTARQLRETCPNALLTEYYGAAELGHVSYQQNDDILQYGYTVGKAFPGVTITLSDQQILVESPYVSPDYRGVNTVFDLGLIEDGRLILLGRGGRMFNRRGLNVFAEEIESCARELSFIRDVAAVGLLRDDLSHDICLAFSCTYPGERSSGYHRQLKDHLLHSLPQAKQPRRILECRDLPRMDSGKLDYQAIVHLFAGEEEPAF